MKIKLKLQTGSLSFSYAARLPPDSSQGIGDGYKTMGASYAKRGKTGAPAIKLWAPPMQIAVK